MNTKPQISVIIATYNRAKILRDTLEAFTHLIPPTGGWELIVIDNNSTDYTRQVCEEFAKILPIQYVFEHQQGKNYALNTGLEKANGELLVFTDDDVSPDAHWLLALERGAKRNPDAFIFGGGYREKVIGNVPTYVLKAIKGTVYFGGTRHREDMGPYVRGELPDGINLTIRREIFFKYGYRYNVTFGPRGKGRVSGGETELLLRLREDGFKMIYLPDALVFHRWYPHQFALQRLLRRSFGIGRGEARLHPPHVPRILGVPRYLISACLIELVQMLKHLLKADRASALKGLLRVSRYIGHAYESYCRPCDIEEGISKP